MDNKPIKEIIILDKECPLNIYLTHLQKYQGEKSLKSKAKN